MLALSLTLDLSVSVCPVSAGWQEMLEKKQAKEIGAGG